MSTQQNPGSPLRQLAVALALFLLIVVCRWTIDTPNFQPVMAVGLLGGFLFSKRWMGLAVVLCGMLASDLILGFYQWQIAIVVYISLAIPVLFGPMLRRFKDKPLSLAGNSVVAAMATAVLFYLTTNFAIWSMTPWYSPDAAGFVTCFTMAAVFFKWTLASNVIFTSILFGGYSLVTLIANEEIGPRKRARAFARKF